MACDPKVMFVPLVGGGHNTKYSKALSSYLAHDTSFNLLMAPISDVCENVIVSLFEQFLISKKKNQNTST